MKKTRKLKLVAQSTAFDTGRKTIYRNSISIMDDDEELLFDPKESRVSEFEGIYPIEVLQEIDDNPNSIHYY